MNVEFSKKNVKNFSKSMESNQKRSEKTMLKENAESSRSKASQKIHAIEYDL